MSEPEELLDKPWANASDRYRSCHAACNVPALYRALYETAKQIQAAQSRYNAGADTVFVGTMKSVMTVEELAELGAMLAPINALVTDWDTNHADAVKGWG